MGINGLLPALRSITQKRHIKEYAGEKVAVDAFCWLHRGAISCSLELHRGYRCRRHVDYCMSRVDMLLSHGVQPVMVFDGGILPSKESEDSKRAAARRESRQQAEALYKEGKYKQARERYTRAVNITPAIAHDLIRELRHRNVEFLVAPYEADAQMAFLASQGLVHAVVTEDSDMIAHACPRVLFKMDRHGMGQEIQFAHVPGSTELALSDFSPRMLLDMCVLSGCDYLPSLPYVGLKVAHSLIRRFKTVDKAFESLRQRSVVVSEAYEAAYERAICTYLHHRVYHPHTQQVQHLNPLPPHLTNVDLSYLGPDLPSSLARAIAEGEVNPITHQPYEQVLQSPSTSSPASPPRPSRPPHPVHPTSTFHPSAKRSGASRNRSSSSSGAAAVARKTPMPMAFLPCTCSGTCGSSKLDGCTGSGWRGCSSVGGSVSTAVGGNKGDGCRRGSSAVGSNGSGRGNNRGGGGGVNGNLSAGGNCFRWLGYHRSTQPAGRSSTLLFAHPPRPQAHARPLHRLASPSPISRPSLLLL